MFPNKGIALAKHDYAEVADEDHIINFCQGKFYEYSIKDDIVTITSDEIYVRITLFRFKKHFDVLTPIDLNDSDEII